MKLALATVLMISSFTAQAMAAPVKETRDAGGKNLGSFFGGFIVSPCAP